MKPNRVHFYVGTVVILALGALFVQDWVSLSGMTWQQWRGLVALILLGLVAEGLTLPIDLGKKSGSTASLGFLPLLSCILLFGTAPAVLLMATTGVVGEFIIRKKELIKAVFNSSQYVFAASVGGLVFSSLGGTALALGEVEIQEVVGTQAVAFIGFGLTFVVLNNSAVSLAITLSEGSKLRNVWARIIGRSGTNLFYDILVSPIAIAVAFFYLELKTPGLLIVIFPLFFIRQAYLTIVQLRQANRDLLTALVKAIETRDPYTSGHSLRVASLAVLIADSMGLSPNKQRDVEFAALLHDIGKIEAVYSEILSKPDDLTDQEREIIESHVTKGVELLQQLSSFSKPVVEGVKGHHERVDGKGYPQGLKGDQIPIAARIIKVCDAIDAMLSDRPYRKALSLEQVKEQLVIYSGIQFDLEVVKAAIDGNILETHKAEVDIQRRQAEVGQGRSVADTGTRVLAT